MRKTIISTAAALLLAGTVQIALSQAGAYAPAASDADLIKALPNAKHQLAEVLMTVTKGTEVPIEAKFEIHEGKLFVGAYTSAKGLGTIAEKNAFKEYNGDATMAAWTPATEEFKDLEHIARSAQYHTLLTMTKLTLADMVKKASTAGTTVLSVKEMVRNNKPVFEVVTLQGGALKAQYYDLVSGDPITG
jgi:hypothetical protein